MLYGRNMKADPVPGFRLEDFKSSELLGSISMHVRVPLFGDLISKGIPYGTSFMIEFEPDSSYYRILGSVVHYCLSAGYVVSFFDYTRFPEEIRRDPKR